MIPLRDNIPARTTPYVNQILIAACIGVFLMQLRSDALTEQLAMIPARVFDDDGLVPVEDFRGYRRNGEPIIVTRNALPAAVPDWLTVLTCTFLHGGWLHLIGNMWFLWIFGDNVEDRLGHGGYLAFYLGCGAAASVTHLMLSQGSTVPTVGASGAIAGVMGAYLMLYPRALVLTLVPLLFIMQMLVLPAWLFLGFWFVIQILQGTFAIGDLEAGGVAWWAHVGGFVAGVVLVLALRRDDVRPAVTARRPNADRVGHYPLQFRRRF